LNELAEAKVRWNLQRSIPEDTPHMGRCFCLLAALCVAGAAAGQWQPSNAPQPQNPVAAAESSSPSLSIEQAVSLALEANPELASIRQQHGIAAAGVVIARTYPFNPVYEGRVREASGEGVTNHVASEHTLLLEMELRGQRRYRRREACATLSRTDWEIATQELGVAIRVLRAFATVLYREDKLRLVEETKRFNEEVVQQVARLLQAGRVRGGDLILARNEVDDATSLVGPARGQIATARADLRRLLGTPDQDFFLVGTLPAKPAALAESVLMTAALGNRPELGARRAALAEADARIQLAIANRFGNITAGPNYEVNESSDVFIGAQMAVPIPLFNRHQGDIQQRKAERARTALEVRETEIDIRQDVRAALARLATAQAAVATYSERVLPNLTTALQQMELLFRQADPGVDVLRLIEVRRRLIHARDGYLDAQWELSQAWADMAAALGDPTIAWTPLDPVEVLPRGRQTSR
jgi:cobalt-zinc-cadmium efflux system outer membrane protein